MRLRRPPLIAIATAVLGTGVLTARGSRLLVQAPTDCTGSVSLLWYNPGTQAEQWLIRPPAHVIGVTVAVPFYSRQNGNL